MKIKKFSAQTIPEALTQIKREMGPEAIVLGTARRRVKGRADLVEVVAAVGEEVEQMAKVSAKPSNSRTNLTEMRKLDRDILSELRQIEMRLQDIVESVIADAYLCPDSSNSFVRGLLTAGFDPMLLRDSIKLEDLARAQSQQGFVRSILEGIPIVNPTERVSIFVGPSGSGKTTSLLKVARRCATRGKARPIVAFLGPKSSRDIIWLKREARNLKAKFHHIDSCSHLERLIEKHPKTTILVDTPGISKIEDTLLRSLVDLSKALDSVRLNLVIEATMDPQNMFALVSCIPGSPNMGLVLTKMDEATRIGGALSVALSSAVPLTYVTGGARSTDGIFVADYEVIAEKIFEGLNEVA